uniref:Uncharacterized protein n=1 Tax=Aquisalinus luteolus TaxID=1566827 RepID=A0A8J3A3N9_9PROT|nr:hypothetical protein GCM10011355_26850 [Aquisalinus luteolus]
MQLYGPNIDGYQKDKTPDRSFANAYQAAFRLYMIETACTTTPAENTYADRIAGGTTTLETELTSNTADKCKVIGNDLYSQLNKASAWLESAPDRLVIYLNALRRINALLDQNCPAELKPAIKQLNADIDGFETAAKAWPACNPAMQALGSALDDVSANLTDVGNDPQALWHEKVASALETYRTACAPASNWTRDFDQTIEDTQAAVEKRTQESRAACNSAIQHATSMSVDMRNRSEAYRPGCDDAFDLERTLNREKVEIENSINNACALYPDSIAEIQGRLAREKRLVDELKAEDSVMRYRLDSGETDAVSCN